MASTTSNAAGGGQLDASARIIQAAWKESRASWRKHAAAELIQQAWRTYFRQWADIDPRYRVGIDTDYIWAKAKEGCPHGKWVKVRSEYSDVDRWNHCPSVAEENESEARDQALKDRYSSLIWGVEYLSAEQPKYDHERYLENSEYLDEYHALVDVFNDQYPEELGDAMVRHHYRMNGYKGEDGSRWAWRDDKPVFWELERKVKLLTIKKDLIAAAYHPSRVERWLEHGGFDLLEAMMG